MDDLNVAINRQPGGQQIGKKIKTFLSLPKAIFLILGIILLIELIYAVRVLIIPVPTPRPVNSAVNQVVTQHKAGRISLVASKKIYRVNEVVPVSVLVNTGGSMLDGVDLIVHFNPKILQATPAGLVKGKILDDYPTLAVDSNKGLISISGISNVKNGYEGTGLFALINLRAKAPGATSLTIDFQGKAVTTDSNLVESTTSKDILEQVDNLELNVQ